jgi:hypothetical protein
MLTAALKLMKNEEPFLKIELVFMGDNEAERMQIVRNRSYMDLQHVQVTILAVSQYIHDDGRMP